MGELREVIRSNIERYIVESKYSQKEVAEKLGVSQSSITNWIKGKNSPDVDLVIPICDLFGVSVAELFSDGNPTSKKTPLSATEAAPGETLSETDTLASTLLHNFDQLNQEGRERLVETSDDMVSSGKYIKSGSNQVDKTKGA